MIDPSTLKTLDLETIQPPMDITLVTPDSGIPELSRFVAEKLAKGEPFGLDTETNWCGDFFFRKIRTIQVGDKTQQFVIDLREFAGSLDKLAETQGYYKCHPLYQEIIDILKPALCDNKVLKVGQNLSFEYVVLYWNFGIRIWHLYSTDLAERVIQAGAISLKKMAEFSMKAIVARRFNVLVDKDEQDSFWTEAPLTPKQLRYAAFDTRMPLSMREHQLREMNASNLVPTGQIENDALGAYADMHLSGMLNDGTRWMKRIDNVMAERTEQLKILDTEFIKKVGRKEDQIDFVEMARREDIWRKGFETPTEAENAKAEEIRRTRDNAQKALLRAELDAMKKARAALKAEAKKSYMDLQKAHTKFKSAVPKMEGEAYINYGSNDQLLEALKKFQGMSTLTSAGDEHLLKYNDRPFIQILRKYRKGKKDTGTYGKQWTEKWITGPGKKIEGKKNEKEGWVHPWDGRIHAVFQQLEAETGRSSCAKPNMQNLPRVDEVRACFICDPPDAEEPEGYVIVTTDMAGAELRIIAELANATSWIRAFQLGHDVHSVSTEILEPEKWTNGAAAPGELDKKGNPLPPCAYFEQDGEGNPKRQKCECPKHKALRDNTKAVNFLLCYGGGPDALADDLGITVDAAKELMKKHEKAFPDVWRYLDDSGKRAQRMNEARDLYGRRRLLPPPTYESAKEYYKDEHADRLELDEDVQEKNIFNFKAAYMREPTAEEKHQLTHREPTHGEIQSAMRGLHGSIGRRGKNHCIQGSNASIIKRAMGCGFDKDGVAFLWHSLPQYKAKLLSMIHDELVIQCPKRFGQQVGELVSDAFRRAAQEVMKSVVMESEYRISDRWQK